MYKITRIPQSDPKDRFCGILSFIPFVEKISIARFA